MKGATIALDRIGTREAAALIVDGQLDDLLVETDGPRPGAIYRAIAERPVKGQGGMFLRTPDGSAFVRQIKGVAPGDRMLVQVTGHAEPGKAIPVTLRILFKSRYAIVTPGAPGLNISRQIRDDDAQDDLREIAQAALTEMPLPDGAGLILRSAAEGADDAEVGEDILAMVSLATEVLADTEGEAELLVEGDGPHTLAWRDWPAMAAPDADADAFERHGVWDALEDVKSACVPLPGGGSMWVEPTRALVAVDINTGGDTSPAAGLKANLAALKILPRALRLRGLGGQVLVDLAPMAKKDRKQAEGVLRAALKRDSIETVLAGWTQLGLMELQRKRARPPLGAILRDET